MNYKLDIFPVSLFSCSVLVRGPANLHSTVYPALTSSVFYISQFLLCHCPCLFPPTPTFFALTLVHTFLLTLLFFLSLSNQTDDPDSPH